MIFCNTFSIGGFGPLLPEIARAPGLGGRRLRATLVAAPLSPLAGGLLLGSAGPLAILVTGRFLMGAGHALGMVGGLTALLERGEGAAFRLNTFEFSGMLSILGGITLVGLLPPAWSWNRSFLVVCGPQLAVLALLPVFWRRFSAVGERARFDPAARAVAAPAVK